MVQLANLLRTRFASPQAGESSENHVVMSLYVSLNSSFQPVSGAAPWPLMEAVLQSSSLGAGSLAKGEELETQ